MYLHFQTHLDTARLQLIDQKMRRIWDLDLAEVRCIVTVERLVDSLLRIDRCHQPRLLVNPYIELVRAVEHTLLQQLTGTVGQQTITLHLTEPETTHFVVHFPFGRKYYPFV